MSFNVDSKSKNVKIMAFGRSKKAVKFEGLMCGQCTSIPTTYSLWLIDS